ncbi:class I SAM-dependent methyltransferase [Pseudodesulfovibrio sp.]|uniref:class I SAM-dependent methyltransferase n=1 Tax=Pseudodesulfovibrio sp. TaxID=2035812 RepID=UPI00260B8348|nr:class I SAM-dependent methyltransferase [Pseudodesulfovibrio sp.]MDD3310501.1 class I SAM-dependent methyltransferase [Pseudodesulfovibrio sp.]
MTLEQLRISIINSSIMRKAVFEMVPEGASRILDVGCGRGGLLLRLQRDKACTELYGVDMDQDAIARLRHFVDYAGVADIEKEEILPARYKGFFNLVIMHDFVEHLFDPWQTLARIRDYLAEGGLAIISTPNLLHWRLQYEIMSGRFPYGHGIWHPGHLRWYTPASLLTVLAIGGYEVRQYCLELGADATREVIQAKRGLTTIQFPPTEVQRKYPDMPPFTIQYPKDIRPSYAAFFATKLIAVCARGALPCEPQPMTYNVDLIHQLTEAVANPYDLFNPPPMTLLKPGSFPREDEG